MASRVKWTSRKYVERCRGLRDLAGEVRKVQRATGMGRHQALQHVRRTKPELIEAAKRTRPGA